MSKDCKLLTPAEFEKIEGRFKQMLPADLEVISQILWRVRKQQYAEWDKKIASHPLKPRK